MVKNNKQSPFSEMIQQLLDSSSSRVSHGVVAWPVNPFPKGMRSGSGTECILAALHEVYPRWVEHFELMEATGCSRGAVDWGIRYLEQNGMARSIPSSRNPQYLRYQATNPKGHEL